MSIKNTQTIQVLKNQNNSQELFIKWNINNKMNVKCAKIDCSNNTNKAYIVQQNIYTQKQYIIPLCEECYNYENNIKNQSKNNFIDFGSIISIDKDLLLEYNSII